MPTLIRFDKDHKLEVNEDPKAVRDAIRGVGAANVPIIQLTRSDGEPIWLNAREIREISSPKKYRSASFQ